MPDKLREFIYLNQVSVNSHLSSLGVGKPREIVEQSETSSQTTGRGDLKVVKGDHTRGNLDSTETTMEATAPYQFEQLLQELDDQDIPIHDNPDPRSVTRGNMVRISGECRPMSLYRIELAVKSFMDILDEETLSAVDEATELQEEDTEEPTENGEPADRARTRRDEEDDIDAEALVQFLTVFDDLAETFIGESVPIRQTYLDDNGDEQVCVTTLDRNDLLKNGRDAFVDEIEYVLVGRVEQRLSRNDEWDPIKATNIFQRYLGQEELAEDSHDDWKEIAGVLDLEMTDKDLLITDRSLVIHPIAMYW